ncbi:MAG: hypothetical protein JNJ77_00625 [Planctomycetia bacterium]|nr:hypothetical protein [Planctomycetia bacterium]
MLKHLRRWHFDLAIFAGLALFAWAYWYSIPRPTWQVPLIDTVRYEMRSSQLVGEVALNDQSSCYVECFDTVTKEVHRYIERRSLTAGDLLQKIEIELPVNVKGKHPPYKLAGSSHSELLIFSTLQTPSAEGYMNCFVSRNDGKPVGPVIEAKTNELLFVLERAKNQQDYWALRSSFTLPGSANKSQNPSPSAIINLSTGKVIKEFAVNEMKPLHAALTPDRLYLLLFRAQDKYLIELYNTRDWTVQYTSQPIQGFLSYHVQFLPDDTIILNNYIKSNPANSTLQQQFRCYRIDPKSQVLQELDSHPLHGLTFKQGTFIVPPHLIEVTHQENKPFASPFLATLEKFFSIVGITQDYSQKRSITIRDLDSQKPLRHIEGLANEEFQHSPDWHKLIMLSSVMKDNKLINYSLSAYPIHTVEWNTTLQWTRYLAWILIIPWPLRYLVMSRPKGGCR